MGYLFGQLWKYYNDGGPVMWLISACAIFAIYVIIYKLIVFFRSGIDTSEFVTKVRKNLLSENVDGAISHVIDTINGWEAETKFWPSPQRSDLQN